MGLCVVATVYRQPEARVIVSMLRAYGIPAAAFNIETVAASTGWTLAIGGMPICVPAECWEDAAELLAQTEFGAVGATAPPPYSRFALINATVAILLAALCGVPPPPRVAGRPHGWRPRPGATLPLIADEAD